MRAKVSLVAQLEEVDRDLDLRRRVYPFEVARGKMRRSAADFYVSRLEAVRNTLAWLQANEALIKERLGNDQNREASHTDAAPDAPCHS